MRSSCCQDFRKGSSEPVAKGQVTRNDYDEVLIPAIETAFGSHRKVRCYYELGREFAGFDAGAMWADARIGFSHLTGWERFAVVTDVDWVNQAINFFHFLVPGEIRLFPSSEAAEARRWIAAGLQ